MKNINLHIQGVQWTPRRINSKETQPSYIIVKTIKKKTGDSDLSGKGFSRLTANFSSQNMEANSVWDNIFKEKYEKKKKMIRILYPAKLSIKNNEGENYPQEFVAPEPSYQKY